ncbi:MAG: hypothetical protein EP344_09935 [Bacteroidetes bacterium]|nr:MAG: hypothetical protein EP344_09935 [Bacteroidota bacterium]
MADNFQHNKNSVIINRSTVNSGKAGSPQQHGQSKDGLPDWGMIKQLIGNNRLDAAFEAMEPWLQATGDTRLENDFYQLKSQFQEIGSLKVQTTQAASGVRTQQAQLVRNMLELVDALKQASGQ